MLRCYISPSSNHLFELLITGHCHCVHNFGLWFSKWACISRFGRDSLPCDLNSLMDLRKVTDFSVCSGFFLLWGQGWWPPSSLHVRGETGSHSYGLLTRDMTLQPPEELGKTLFEHKELSFLRKCSWWLPLNTSKCICILKYFKCRKSQNIKLLFYQM